MSERAEECLKGTCPDEVGSIHTFFCHKTRSTKGSCIESPDLKAIAKQRKAQPVATGVLAYFPDALIAVSEISKIGNDFHNPGEPLHWAKEKSTDEPDALARHLLDWLRGKRFDDDGGRISAKIAWRALAMLQREIEGEQDGVK